MNRAVIRKSATAHIGYEHECGRRDTVSTNTTTIVGNRIHEVRLITQLAGYGVERVVGVALGEDEVAREDDVVYFCAVPYPCDGVAVCDGEVLRVEEERVPGWAVLVDQRLPADEDSIVCSGCGEGRSARRGRTAMTARCNTYGWMRVGRVQRTDGKDKPRCLGCVRR